MFILQTLRTGKRAEEDREKGGKRCDEIARAVAEAEPGVDPDGVSAG